MTDDLIKFLRTSTSSAYNKVAADRIEELVEERDTARRLLGAATQMQTETQAKLAKAVEALHETDQAIMFHTDETSWRIWGEGAVSDIRKVLAELEGGG